jgi:8-hydroxy-5-deazaflavin:NADPH oxidoreductase
MTSIAPDTVAILGGSGQQGRGLAQRLARAGVHVLIGSRDPERAKEAVAGWPAGAAIDVVSNATAVERSTIVVLAVPFGSVDALLGEMAPRFIADAIAIDVTVPVTFAGGRMAMLEVAEGSASEHIRTRLPAGVALAAAFKTIPAHLLGNVEASLDCDEFVCGDTDAARARAVQLVELLPGLRAIDVGPLSRARSIEHLTALAIAINRRHKIHDARFRIVGL